MAANAGWFADWWQSGQFPAAWFAPADDSHLLPQERRNYRMTGGVTSLSTKRKRGFKRPEAPPILAPRALEEDEALLLFCL